MQAHKPGYTSSPSLSPKFRGKCGFFSSQKGERREVCRTPSLPLLSPTPISSPVDRDRKTFFESSIPFSTFPTSSLPQKKLRRKEVKMCSQFFCRCVSSPLVSILSLLSLSLPPTFLFAISPWGKKGEGTKLASPPSSSSFLSLACWVLTSFFACDEGGGNKGGSRDFPLLPSKDTNSHFNKRKKKATQFKIQEVEERERAK